LLEHFFGRGGLDQKLSEMDRALRSSPPILKKFWTVPNYGAWLGVRELRKAAATRFRGVEDPRTLNGVLPALELAARLRQVLPNTPPWKQDELRSRLLSKGAIAAVLMEIDAAAHMLLRGFSIDWVRPNSTAGLRSPEMVVRWPSGEFEIECKAQNIDSGRKIPRRAFYEVCDKVTRRLSEYPVVGMEREIQIMVPYRFEANAVWQNELCDAIVRARNGDKESLADGVVVDVKCRLASQISVDSAQERLRRNAGAFGHGVVVLGRETVLISCRSARPDGIVKAIEKDLSDALCQLSGTRPARILCYVPEVTSFEMLKTGSFIQLMTSRFFDRHPKILHSVAYVSDPVPTQLAEGLESLTQALTFRNPHFQGAFPQDLETSSH
jgi:hypothetical protein